MRRASITPATRLALEATEFAKEQGAYEPFHRITYRAYWEDSKNLGDLQVLLTLGEQAGLNVAKLEEALKDRRYEARVMEQYEEAQSLGINGVPAFVVGRYLFTGAQPYDLFQKVAKMALAEQAQA